MLKCHTSLGLLAKMSALVPSKTVLGLRLLRSLQSSDSFGWHSGGHFCQDPSTGCDILSQCFITPERSFKRPRWTYRKTWAFNWGEAKRKGINVSLFGTRTRPCSLTKSTTEERLSKAISSALLFYFWVNYPSPMYDFAPQTANTQAICTARMNM